MKNAVCFQTVEIYDPSNDKWSKGVDLLTIRAAHTSCVVNGKIYVIGGLDLSKELSSVEEYDTGFRPSQAIQSKGKLPTTWGNKKR